MFTTNKIYINKPSITEREINYVMDAVSSGWGEKCYDYLNKFEVAFGHHLGSTYNLATSSCTGAIHLSLMALGIGAGDEVIVPEITWIASVEPVLYVGAKPIFVDVLKDSWCIDPISIERAITAKTKAIIVVHLYGNVCEMEAIIALAKKYNLRILEDAAEGLGSSIGDFKVGNIADIGVFSFHGTKTMTTGEGGMIATNDVKLYEKVKILNDHGRNPRDPEHKMFWMRNYGYKYKMSNIQAALGLAQVERLDELINRKRQIFEIYKHYLSKFPCQLNPEPEHTLNGYWLPTAVFNRDSNFDREILFRLHKENNIDSRPFFYPLSTLPMFESCESNSVSYEIYKMGINLPSYHDLTENEIKKVVSFIEKAFV